jgi:hypothetical protein
MATTGAERLQTHRERNKDLELKRIDTTLDPEHTAIYSTLASEASKNVQKTTVQEALKLLHAVRSGQVKIIQAATQ